MLLIIIMFIDNNKEKGNLPDAYPGLPGDNSNPPLFNFNRIAPAVAVIIAAVAVGFYLIFKDKAEPV